MKEPKEITIPVPWGHVAAIAYGSPADFPVLLLHGILDNAGTFHRLINRLPSNNYYVTIDLPGHGRSSHFPIGLPLSFFNYVLTLRYVVDELKWSKFHLIGHSLGAQLSIFYASAYPGRIQRLIVIEGLSPPILSERKLIPWIRTTLESSAAMIGRDNKHARRTYERDDIMHSLRWMRKFALNSAAAEAMLDRSVERIGDRYRYARDERLKNHLLPLMNIDQILLLLKNVDAKVLGLFAHTTIEITSPEFVRESTMLVESLIDMKVKFVRGNHDVHNNHPERIAPYVCEFLNDHSLTSKL